MARQPAFALRAIRVRGAQQRATIRAAAMPRLAGNFFSLDLKSAREAFESVPWVRRAVVQRIFEPPGAVSRNTVPRRCGPPTEGEDKWSTATARCSMPTRRRGRRRTAHAERPGSGQPRRACSALQAPAAGGWRRLQMGIAELDMSGRGSVSAELEGGAVIEIGRGSDDELAARLQRASGHAAAGDRPAAPASAGVCRPAPQRGICGAAQRA